MEQLFTPDELARIEAAAQEVGHSPREWVRAVVLHRLNGGRRDLEDAVWPLTEQRRPGGVVHELHHAGCWVPKGGEATLSTAEARSQVARQDVRLCDACQPERFLGPVR